MENKFLPKTVTTTSFEHIIRAQQVRTLRLNVVLVLAILTISLFLRYSYSADSYIIDSSIKQQYLHTPTNISQANTQLLKQLDFNKTTANMLVSNND